MNLEISGTIIKVLSPQTGSGKNGTWQKQDFIIETKDQYPKKVCCTAWGDKVNALKSLGEGDEVNVAINLESREYNERWYTEIKAWKIEPMSKGSSSSSNSPAPDAGLTSFDGEEEDLPF